MKVNQIAAQLYTLRDYLKTPEMIPGTLKKVRDIGYEAVQLSGLCPMDAKELRKMLDDAGLVCCATHENPQEICDEPQKLSDMMDVLGTTYTAYPYPGNVKLISQDSVLELCQKLNHAGKVFKANGKVLTYHNHHTEFMKFDGKLVLDTIYEQTDPEYLQGEIDTYWVQFGGQNPTEWCQKLANRLPLLHLKDYRINHEVKPEFAEIGYGNLNWNSILPAAEASGCLWFIVEQDICPGSPFDSLKLSFDYMKANLCK